MTVKLILIEGSHEVSFIHRLILLNNNFSFIKPTEIKVFEQKYSDVFGQKRINLTEFYKARLAKGALYNDRGHYYDLAPFFYFNLVTNTLVITWNYEGRTNKKLINEAVELLGILIFDSGRFAKDEIKKFSIFIQTDADDNIEASKDEFVGQFEDGDCFEIADQNSSFNELNINSDIFRLKAISPCFNFVDEVIVYLYLLTTNIKSTDGNLDSVIQTLLQQNTYFDIIKEMVHNEAYRTTGLAKKRKCIIGALGQEFAGGYSNSVMLSNSDFISDIQIMSTDFSKAVNYFLNE